jgi:hypothetical protein
MDFLQANWPWLLLGVVALGWLLSRAGRGCGAAAVNPTARLAAPRMIRMERHMIISA